MSTDMSALVYDRSKDDWEKSRGLRKVRVPRPSLDEASNPTDAESAIVKILYTGFCGSDRGIWFRNAFRSMIERSLEDEHKNVRVVGHELLGRVDSVGSKVTGFEPGQVVAAESHITCGTCPQCLRGDRHVCTNEKIIGFSRDGCFAEYIKLPASVLWPTDDSRINRYVGAIQEPFGNAVHAATRVPLQGKSVAMFGCGPIGLFTILVTRALGAARIIGIEPNDENAKLALRLGVDEMVRFTPDPESWKSDREVVDAVRDHSGGGVDVAFEMAGFNSSVNNSIRSVAEGGDVILFGIKGGDFTIESFSSIIVRGVTMHSIIGRHIWETWETTRRLLEDKSNQIHDKILDVILNNGDGTVVHIDDFEIEDFQERIMAHPKVIIQWSE